MLLLAGSEPERKHATLETLYCSVAVSELVDVRAELVEESNQEVPHRYAQRAHMASALEARGPSRENNRQIPVYVPIAFAHARSIDQLHMIEQRTIAIRCRLQLV